MENPSYPGSQNAEQTIDRVAAGNTWWKVCCAGCLLLVLAVFGGTYLLVRVLAGPTQEKLTSLPQNFPADIKLFKMSEADSITYVKGKTRGKLMSILASPALLLSNLVGGAASSTGGLSTGFSDAIKQGVSNLEGRDNVTVSWTRMDVSKQEVMDYYNAMFKVAGMSATSVREEASGTDMMLGQRKDVALQLYLQDSPDTKGVETLDVVVDYLVK